jgi:hypothetical protein
MKKGNGKNIIIILLIVIVVALVALCVYYKLKLDAADSKDNVTSNEPKVEESIKIDDSKDYVYDATYSYSNKYTEYNAWEVGDDSIEHLSDFGIDVEYHSNTQYLKNLIVPYININSDDAKNANKTLKELYEKYAKQFDECGELAESRDNGPSCTQILTYRTYSYNNILSIVVIDSSQSTSAFRLNYTIFNFDLKTGKKLSYSELLSKLGYDESESQSDIKALIKKKLPNLPGNDNDKFPNSCYDKNGNFTNCYDLSYSLFDDSIKDGSTLAFSDNDGRLNIFVYLPLPDVEPDYAYYLITVLQ